MIYDAAMGFRHGTGMIKAGAHLVATGFEVAAVAVIVVVSMTAAFMLIRQLRQRADWSSAILGFRTSIGRGVLTGLELLVAADIVGTIAVTPTFESLGILGLIIAIRTFLSVSLTVEIDGNWPWRRHKP